MSFDQKKQMTLGVVLTYITIAAEFLAIFNARANEAYI